MDGGIDDENGGIGRLLARARVACCRCSKDDRSHAKAAQEEFTKTDSCPASSVVATPRNDLKAYDLQVGASAPPSEVAADQARLTEWKKQQERVRSGYDRMSIVQTSGCGHSIYYVCSLANSTNEQYTIACTVAAHPPK
jgi:hypothetical protein